MNHTITVQRVHWDLGSRELKEAYCLSLTYGIPFNFHWENKNTDLLKCQSWRSTSSPAEEYIPVLKILELFILFVLKQEEESGEGRSMHHLLCFKTPKLIIYTMDCNFKVFNQLSVPGDLLGKELTTYSVLPTTPACFALSKLPRVQCKLPYCPKPPLLLPTAKQKMCRQISFGKGVLFPRGTVIQPTSQLCVRSLPQRHKLKLRRSNGNFQQWKPLWGIFSHPIFLISLALLLLPASWLNSYKRRTINPKSYLLQLNTDSWF